MDKNQPTNDEMKQVELFIGKVLRVGVIFSATIMIIGLLLLIFTNQSGYANNQYPFSFTAIYQGVIALKPYAIMMFGIFCLILTPVLRVVISIYSFYKEHDNLYVVITCIVLVILLTSFIIGIN